MKIDSLEDWNALLPLLVDAGYSLWQMQHGIDHPQGFHAWFIASGRRDIEVVTHSLEVHAAILAYRT
jgi:hypothetical protein